MSSTTNSTLDPFTAKAENPDLSPQEKINGLHEILKSTKTGMLTTRASDGHLHSRAMAPCSPLDSTQLTLTFIANNASQKFAEIENDAKVNVSFYDPSNTNWVSYAGTARVSRDKELIKKHWSSYVSAYFGNLKDGIHKGDENDPRVSIIEVIPDDICYWIATHGTIRRAVDVAVGVATGKTAAPGELRTITKEEIMLTQGLHTRVT